ncbi:MAG: hypothetical protein Q9227_002021 [Pyrenula ochraceoflavens]
MPHGDRTFFAPRHIGDTVLPNEPLFSRLLHHANAKPARTAVRDLNAHLEKTYLDLLNDVISLRRDVKAKLPTDVVRDLEYGREVYIGVLAPGGYEFAVAVLTALSLGPAAAVSPLNVNQPVEEASYYVKKAKMPVVLTSSGSLELGHALERRFHCLCMPIGQSLSKLRLEASQLLLSSDLRPDPNLSGMLIFTSGTTGPPKGAVIRRGALVGEAFHQSLGVSHTDVLCHLLPVHHATGIWVGFFPWLYSGACIEYKSGSFDPEWTWNRWRQGGLTFFSGVPTIYMRMMRYYQTTLSKLPPHILAEYTRAPAQFRVCLCGTSALPLPISQFWSQLLNGRHIKQRFGSTETGVVYFNSLYDESTPDGSVGEAALGVDQKLSEGDEGEILVKSPTLFAKYLDDPEATRAAHDENGFFKTGDIARREGKYYFITGRASVDIIKSGGYKISALDIEREMLSLPYIAEAMVVGIPSAEFGQRVAALVTLRTDGIALDFLRQHQRALDDLVLDDLRSDLRHRLAGYKLPTVLFVLKGEIPKSPTNKVVKKILGPQFFPEGYETIPGMQKWEAKKERQLSKL